MMPLKISRRLEYMFFVQPNVVLSVSQMPADCQPSEPFGRELLHKVVSSRNDRFWPIPAYRAAT